MSTAFLHPRELRADQWVEKTLAAAVKSRSSKARATRGMFGSDRWVWKRKVSTEAPARHSLQSAHRIRATRHTAGSASHDASVCVTRKPKKSVRAKLALSRCAPKACRDQARCALPSRNK